MILVCSFQWCWRIFSNGRNQNRVRVGGSVYFLCWNGLWSVHFFPRLPNSFFFFQKIQRCYLDTEHRGRQAFLACVAREPHTQISHSIQHHSVFTLCWLSDKRKNKAVCSLCTDVPRERGLLYTGRSWHRLSCLVSIVFPEYNEALLK